MAAGDIRAGRAFIEIVAKDAGFNKDLDATKKAIESLSMSAVKVGESFAAAGAKMLALGTAIVAPLVGAGVTFAKAGDELDEMSKRTGVSVEALSQLRHAANLSGASMADLETAIKRMQRTIADASGGSKEAAASLAKLGLSAQMLQGLRPDTQFQVIAQRLKEVQDPAQKAAQAMEVFGRSGTSILPLTENLAALRQEAVELGLTMSTEEAQAAAKFQDSLDTLRETALRLRDAIGAALTPTLLEWTDRIRVAVTAGIAWVQSHKDAALAVLRTGIELIAAGTAVLIFGKLIVGTTQAIMGIVNVTTVAVKAIAFLASPIAGVALAVAALAAGLLALIGGGSKLGSLVEDVKSAAATLDDLKLSIDTAELDKLKKQLAVADDVNAQARANLAPASEAIIPTPGFERAFVPNTPEQERRIREAVVRVAGENEVGTISERTVKLRKLAKASFEVMGTFSAAALGRQGIGSTAVQDKILDATEEQNALQREANKFLAQSKDALVKIGNTKFVWAQ